MTVEPANYTLCEGGPVLVYDLAASTVQCPGCDNHFTFLADPAAEIPVVPPHQLGEHGEFTNFRPADTDRIPFRWAWHQQQLHGIEQP